MLPSSPCADLFVRRRGIVLQQLVRRHDHPGRAETALQPVLVPEGFLDRMQRAVAAQPFDGRNRAAVGLDGETGARPDGDSVEEDRARAALARVAADLRAGDASQIADEVHQQQAGFYVALISTAVDRQADRDFHGATSDARGQRLKTVRVTDEGPDYSRVASRVNRSTSRPAIRTPAVSNRTDGCLTAGAFVTRGARLVGCRAGVEAHSAA